MNTRTESTIDGSIGKKIKFFRKMANLSQKKLANQIGVSFQQLQKYESGENRITAGRLWVISTILKVEMEVFCSDIGREKVFVNDVQTTNFLRRYYKLQPESRIALLCFLNTM